MSDTDRIKTDASRALAGPRRKDDREWREAHERVVGILLRSAPEAT